MKTKLNVLSAMLVLMLSALACGLSSGPGSTVVNFFRAIEKGEIQEAKSYMSSSTLQTLGTDKWDVALAQLTQEISNQGGIDKIKITEEDTTGDISKVTAQITFGDGSVETSVMDLIKEDGQWKLQINPYGK
jgi:hypothetical protein